MNIDRNKLSKIEAEIVAALSEVSAKYGLVLPAVDLRRARNGTFCRLMKMDFVVSSNVAAPPALIPSTGTNAPQPALVAAMKRLGITKTINAKGEQLIAYKPSRRVYPFTTQGPRGGRWKATEAAVLRMFA